MTESMPSRVQPAQAAQKPVICERLSLVRVAAPEYETAMSDMVLPPHRVHAPGRKQFVGQHTTGGRLGRGPASQAAEKLGKQTPHGLKRSLKKSERNIKNKGLIGTTEVVP